MSKVNQLIDFLKQIPYTERKNLYSCQHMSLEDDSPLGGQFVRVDEKDTTNYFSIEVETQYFSGGDNPDEFGYTEVERTEVTEVTDVNYFTESADMIKIEEATKEQLSIIYSELPANY